MKKSKTALVAMVIGVIYAVYALSYWFGANTDPSLEASEALGAGLATAIVMPHLVTAIIGALFNVIGFFANNRGFILAAAILYTIALAVFPPYFFFVLIQMILCYIAFVRMGKAREEYMLGGTYRG